jgi:hypothetical protein
LRAVARSTLRPSAKADKPHALAVTTSKRFEGMLDIPTVGDTVLNYEASQGLAGRKCLLRREQGTGWSLKHLAHAAEVAPRRAARRDRNLRTAKTCGPGQSRSHSAHIGQEVVIHYRWHLVRAERASHSGRAARIG